MKHTANSLKWLVLILILALALSACERPVPGSDVPTPDTGVPGEAPILTIPTIPPEGTIPQTGPYPAPGEPGPVETPGEGVTDGTAPAPGEGSGETGEPAPAEPVGETPAEPTGERIHVVRSGENLYRIGLQYGFTWQELATYNNLANPNSLDVGQEIRIPPTP